MKNINTRLLNIILKLAKETNKQNKKSVDELLSVTSEDSFIMGIDIYNNPLNKMLENIDNYFDRNIDKNKYPHGGGDLSYAIYERNILENNQETDIEYESSITLRSGKEYKISNVKNTILYYEEVIIPNFIEEELVKNKTYNLNITDIEKDISITLLGELLNFYKLTMELSEKFATVLLKFCNKDFCNEGQLWECYPAIKNLEENIEKPLKKINTTVWENVFYEFYEEFYKLNKEILYYPKDIKEFNTKFTYEIKNKTDFCKWFLYNFKN